MKTDENIFYSEDFYAINRPNLFGWAVHVLCLEGAASFTFHGRRVEFRRGDVVIFSNAELVSELRDSDDLRVEIIAMRSSYAHRILPSQHYGIGGRVSLFHDPVLTLSEEEFRHLHESVQHLRSYLSSMDRAELLHLIYSDNKSVTKMQKPDKIFIHNPNMLCTLANNVNIGTLRECFFVNQLSVNHTVEYGKTQGDFLIDGRWRIEVGGKDKTFDQIANLPDSYIFADMMENPVGKKLPLWMAGLTY